MRTNVSKLLTWKCIRKVHEVTSNRMSQVYSEDAFDTLSPVIRSACQLTVVFMTLLTAGS